MSISCARIGARVNPRAIPDDLGADTPPMAGSALLRRLAVGDLLDEIDDAAPKLGIGDAREGAGEGEALGRREEVRDVGGRSALGETVGTGHAGRAALKKEGHRDLEDFRNLLDPAGTDAIGAFLVFLNLLEGQA